MNAPPNADASRGDALTAHDVHKRFQRETGESVDALQAVSLTIHHGTLTALVGPDGAGKTTFLRLAAGLMSVDSGTLEVLGVDVNIDPQQIQDRISYMPQRFGLYEDLSVQENLDLYADLHGIPSEERAQRYPRLMEMTALGPFRERTAGKLSGGMKQKLGLACTLVRSPELLLLDEPTVGVDPLSRRELWEIVQQLVREEGLSVVVSTSYLDEAERCDHVLVLNQGKALTQGTPEEVRQHAQGLTFIAQPREREPARALQARLLDELAIIDAVPHGGQVRFIASPEQTREGAPDVRSLPALRGAKVEPIDAVLEDGFMLLLRQAAGPATRASGPPNESESKAAPEPKAAVESNTAPAPKSAPDGDTVIEVNDLVRKFGDFVAVDHVTFSVRRGEVFGLLGPNGAGKTTTFRMLCGLLPATSGTLRVAGADLRRARASARQRIGYVAQKFALYGQLTVTENLEFFGGTYGLRNARLRERIAWAMRQFELESLARLPSGQLPGGYRQRLAMATALLHEPQILFLDEPTSGADPLARREFWKRITDLASTGTTVVVTTHFMEEAEYCDRLAIQDAGRMLAIGTPGEVRSRASAEAGRIPTMEDAFIAIVNEARTARGPKGSVAA
jgi:pyoluteorin transport system ATP-binding protein